ncbi:MAG: sugar kinase [Ruminococcaceae bacterium]|nr:sugar kinase [Oscillospiraceae bacterium]
MKEEKITMKRYALVVPTSMGVRITPINRQPVHISHEFYMQATSAETNVASVSAALGLPVKVLTTFVEGSPIAQFIKNDLRSRGMEYEGKEVPQGDPWGYRHQFNIADSGFGLRGPRVQNDRAGEVGRTLKVEDFDLERIFGEEGVEVLHLSGLIAALSSETSRFCVELARAAKTYGTKISFDLNHRASFWKGREEELHAAFHEIASLSDILIGNEEDFQLCLKVKGPEAGGKDLSGKIESFKEMILRVQEQYPNATTFATTLRQVINANEHLWGAILLRDGQWHVAEPRPIQVMDRIGGGDGFVGGLLYGILKNWKAEDCLHFGWATGVMAATMLNDYAQPADEEQVWAIWSGNARVKR